MSTRCQKVLLSCVSVELTDTGYLKFMVGDATVKRRFGSKAARRELLRHLIYLFVPYPA